MRQILFLCTGNYYRSRFAEMWFNHLASEAGLPWRAVSRGLYTEMNYLLPGVISPHTVAALTARDVACAKHRSPIECAAADLADADRIIALKETEHRPLMAARFGEWVDQIEYWNIHDVDHAAADATIAQLDQRLRQLIAELQSELPPGPDPHR